MQKPSVIPAGEFKAKCLKLLDEVSEKRTTLVITKRGKPVARVEPVKGNESLFGAMKGSVLYMGDILSSVDAEWEAMEDA